MRRRHVQHKRQQAQQRRFNKVIAPYWKSLAPPKKTFIDPTQYQLPELDVLPDPTDGRFRRGKILPHEMIDAASRGELARVRQAIELDGVDPSYVDPDLWGDTALHRASENGHMNVVRYLCLRANCNTRAKSEANGETAQRAAEKAEQWHIVAFLKGFEQWQSQAEESSTFGTRADALAVSSGDVAKSTMSSSHRLLRVVRPPKVRDSILPNLERLSTNENAALHRK